MNIQLIKALETLQPAKLVQISQAIKLDMLKTLTLIADINNKDEGLIVERAGIYSLSRPINWLQHAKLKELLADRNLTHQFILFDKISSTNTYALNNMANFYTFPIFINGEMQSGGRGRLGRIWTSKVSYDITLSLIYQFPLDTIIKLMHILTHVAINRLLKNYSVRNQIKWPNDIYANGEKVCGILVENLLRNQINHCVIGIGLNNIENWERNKLVADLVYEVDKLISEYNLFGFPLLQREWLDNCIHYRKPITLRNQHEVVATGIHHSISPIGELIVDTENGKQVFNSSALSLRFDDK